MVYVKKLVMKGFKSFIRKTELPFSQGINVVLGPNGSGKSNITDALCFVLGRLSIKSMRAAKAKNLIFLGTKKIGPAKEAEVEIIFDNSDKTFTINKSEVSIKRIVRKNGQSIYKIDNETKTRQQVLALLAQAGIDPNGFNIILQGEIQNFVRMSMEDRRKIIEEVSGISIYESRKEKSIKELKKTEEKLKEVTAILRERTTYLNNLEKERQQALRYKKLENDLKVFKASIINYDLNIKKKHKKEIQEKIQKKDKEIEKIKKEVNNLKKQITNYEEKIIIINNSIQKSTGLEQEKINQEIANLRADLAGSNVKLDNFKNKLNNLQRQKQEFNKIIIENKTSVQELKQETPSDNKKQKEIEKKKKELEEIEKNKKKYYVFKSDLKAIKEKIIDRKNFLQNYKNESNILLKQMQSLTLNLFDKNTNYEKVNLLKQSLEEKKKTLSKLNKKELELEKKTSVSENEIERQKKIIENIAKMDKCPLCKSKITKEHIRDIDKEIGPRIEMLEKNIQTGDKELGEVYQRKKVLNQEIEQLEDEISRRSSDVMKIDNINEKRDQIKILQEKINQTTKEIKDLEQKQKKLENDIEDFSGVERKYETIQIEIQEITLRNKETIDSDISFKQKEIERAQIELNQIKRDSEELSEEIKILEKEINDKNKILEEKKKQEEALNQKFKKMIGERDNFQREIREKESKLSNKNNEINLIENHKNNFKIDNAKIDAEIENLEIEILEFPGVKIIKKNKEALKERLEKTQEILMRIGSVNMRSLEVYDEVKKEYDLIQEKSEIINKEKQGILKVIHSIDVRKKKTFLKTLNELNKIFSKNFSQLSVKGQVYLDLENKKDPFAGGVSIIVKTGHGKYFDVTSLSGGEQTLVALSLIFAIQELNPYCFYILDEIDASLDKRNSERLAGLLKKYMQKGQYIVITHNDEVISNATNLYGISMHEGVSKVTSLEV